MIRSLIRASVWAIALTAGAASAETQKDPYTHFFQDTFGDFTEELELAREEGKKGLLVFFEMDECPFCARMRETVLNRTDVQKWFRDRYRCFTVDIEGDTEVVNFDGKEMPAKDFAFKLHRVRATPVIAFFDLEGKRVVRYTGAPSSMEEFMLLGEFAAEGHYKTTNFTKFKRERRKAAAR